MNYYVYQITNLENGMYYIGAHQDLLSFDKCKYWGSGKRIQRTIKKYGKEKFKKEVLAECLDEKHMYDVEAFFVGPEDIATGMCYNIRCGGRGGRGGKGTSYVRTEKHSQILSELKKGNKYCLGVKHSNEAKQKAKENNIGKHQHLFGRVVSEETKEKLRQSNTGQKRSVETKLKCSESAKKRYAKG